MINKYKKSPKQLKDGLLTFGLFTAALYCVALARGLSGDFDMKFNLALTGAIVGTGLFVSNLIRYRKITENKKEE